MFFISMGGFLLLKNNRSKTLNGTYFFNYGFGVSLILKVLYGERVYLVLPLNVYYYLTSLG